MEVAGPKRISVVSSVLWSVVKCPLVFYFIFLFMKLFWLNEFSIE